VEAGNLGDIAAVGEGVSELQIDLGPGYRVYLGQIGQQVHLISGDPRSVNNEISQPPNDSGANMTRTTTPYREVLLDRLANPDVAGHYLNAAMEDSPEAFLKALKNVAKARQMSKVAKEAGVQRETLSRSLSEQGNPTFGTLSSVLPVLGFRMQIVVASQTESADAGSST
jgi:probable addiction module antidote protein